MTIVRVYVTSQSSYLPFDFSQQCDLFIKSVVLLRRFAVAFTVVEFVEQERKWQNDSRQEGVFITPTLTVTCMHIVLLLFSFYGEYFCTVGVAFSFTTCSAHG